MARVRLSAVYGVVPPGSPLPLNIMVLGSPDRVFGLLEGLGYEGVEPSVPDPESFDAGGFMDSLSRFSLDIGPISTGLSRLFRGVNLSSLSESIRRGSVEVFKAYIELARELGSPGVVVGVARGTCSDDCDRRLEALRRSLVELDPHARDSSVKLLLEPINRYETRLVNSVEEAVKLLEDLESALILYDVFHAVMEESNPYDPLKDRVALVGHVHAADTNRKAPGLGMIEWGVIADILRKGGYRGFVSVEARMEPSPESCLKVAAETLKPLL